MKPKMRDTQPGVPQMLFQGFHFHNGESLFPNLKADIEAREGQAVDSVRIPLVAGPGIVAENFLCRVLFFWGE